MMEPTHICVCATVECFVNMFKPTDLDCRTFVPSFDMLLYVYLNYTESELLR